MVLVSKNNAYIAHKKVIVCNYIILINDTRYLYGIYSYWMNLLTNPNLITSYLMVLPAIMIWTKGYQWMAFSILVTSIVSVANHSHQGKDTRLRILDISLNVFHSIVYGVWLWYRGYVLPVVIIVIVGIIYLLLRILDISNNLTHMILVHVPVLVGWFYLALALK